jgi:type IV fimbrial biogenesis protein FimT
MMTSNRRRRGITLIELMVAVAIISILIMMVAPSFQDMILMQRLRGISAQLNTDLQFARTEAVARGRPVRVNLGGNTNQTCYVLYLADGNGVERCACTRGMGSACAAGDGRVELKTVSIPRSSQVALTWPSIQNSGFAFDFVTGGLFTIPEDQMSSPSAEIYVDVSIDSNRLLRSRVLTSGRPSVCSTHPDRVQVAAC